MFINLRTEEVVENYNNYSSTTAKVKLMSQLMVHIVCVSYYDLSTFFIFPFHEKLMLWISQLIMKLQYRNF